MNAPIYVAPPHVNLGQLPQPNQDVPELLAQMLQLQKQQFELQKAQLAQADERARWAQFYERWSEEFPDVPQVCREALPQLERAYLTLMQDTAQRLADPEADPLDNIFAIADFLDSQGIRLAQLGGILGQFANMAAQVGK